MIISKTPNVEQCLKQRYRFLCNMHLFRHELSMSLSVFVHRKSKLFVSFSIMEEPTINICFLALLSVIIYCFFTWFLFSDCFLGISFAVVVRRSGSRMFPLRFSWFPLVLCVILWSLLWSAPYCDQCNAWGSRVQYFN